MQLKLSVGDEVLKIDVQPTDTFQDITERLYSLGNVKVDLKQLRSTNNDKPFDMTTNVMEYFNKTSKVKMTNDNQTRRDNTLETPKTLSKLPCRLCGETLSSTPSFLFDAPSGEHEVTLAEKVNTALPLHVTKKDPHSKQVCEKCVGFLDKTYDFMRMVLAAQNTLENRLKKVEHMCQLRRDERCPLCNSGHLKSVCRRPSQNPPAVSRKSGVTVQVPKPSASNKWGSKRSLTDDDESSQTEFYMNDEVVTGYWEPPKPSGSSSSGSLNNLSGSGRKYKKKIKTEDDHDWTIDEEYVPVSRRGRPKGRRNKPKIISIVQKTCVLCEWTGSDLDMLAHSVNMHCQPDLDYFPCPMCRTTHPNEMELENHIEDHIAGLRK